MENQLSRKHFREKMIAHFRYEGPENASGQIEQLFSEMTYTQKKTYIRKLEYLAGDEPDDIYLSETIHLAKTILISTRESIVATFGSDVLQSKLLATAFALLLIVAYPVGGMLPYILRQKKEEMYLV